MLSTATLNALAEVQDAIRASGLLLDDDEYIRQYHADLSPLGWHIGHCAFIESYWLQEMVLGDDRLTAPLHYLYFPENIPRPQRGPALPPRHDHLEWCRQRNEDSRELLHDAPIRLQQHPLWGREYLARFILQHHAQHLETIRMVLQQHALYNPTMPTTAITPLVAERPVIGFGVLPAGEYALGSEDDSHAFDNELPTHRVSLQAVALATRPVSNAQWLGFIKAGGYRERHYWSDAGWQWRQQHAVDAPEHWRQDARGNWYGIEAGGAATLPAQTAVYGINYFEAQAFCQWLAGDLPGVRLPHEYEWEAAYNSGLLDNTGEVWEWCENAFHPYPGFSAFPYDGYSKPWFDGKHFSLRGGSRHSHAVIKRASFRNFYNPDKRHIFAGLRLACPA